MVRQLRKGSGQNGLVLANGGVVTYQHVVCLSSRPRISPYPESNPLPAIVTDVPVPTVDLQADGEAVIEVSILLIPNMERAANFSLDVHCRVRQKRRSESRIRRRPYEEEWASNPGKYR